METDDVLEKIFNTLVKAYEEKYGSFSDRNDPYYFMVSDYYATGEGRTISILIATGETEYSAIKEFYELFGSHLLLSVEFVPRNFFFETYGQFIPLSLIQKTIDKGHMNYSSQFHINLA